MKNSLQELDKRLNEEYGRTRVGVRRRVSEEDDNPETALGLEDPRYKIFLGLESRYNLKDFFNSTRRAPVSLRRIGEPIRAYINFSSNLDNYYCPESEHCFLLGMNGMGKTNFCDLLILEFPKRPNPTNTMWIFQKDATATTDASIIEGVLKDREGCKARRITIGEENTEKIPIDSLDQSDIQTWFGLSPKSYMNFQAHYARGRSNGSNMTRILKGFIDASPKGSPYERLYTSALEEGIFTENKSNSLTFRKNETILLDISQLIKTHTNIFADMVTNAYCKYLMKYTFEKRRPLVIEQRERVEKMIKTKNDSALLGKLKEDAIRASKKIHQSLIVFDEFHELVDSYRFDKTSSTINEIALQGRQNGMSLLLAMQSLYGSRKDEKKSSHQAHYLIQFKSSSTRDHVSILNSMGHSGYDMEKKYEELNKRVFNSDDPTALKGRIIISNKNMGIENTKTVKLRLAQQVET